MTEQQQQSLREVLREARGNGVYFCYRCLGPTPGRMVGVKCGGGREQTPFLHKLSGWLIRNI